jgi:type II secretory pathway component PulJ
MIAMGVLAVTAVYLLETFTVNNRNYVALDQTIEAQQNMRAIADLIERDVRHAGFMVPEASAVCGIDDTNGPDILYVSDYEAIDPSNDILSYTGARITAAAGNVGGDVTFTVDSLMLEPLNPARPAYDANADGTNDSDFQRNGGAIVADRNNPGRGVACGRVFSVNVTTRQVRLTALSGGLGAGGGTPELILVPATEYRIDNQLVLLRNGLPIAKNVEDLQVAYFFDLDGDSLISGNEARGAGTGTGYTPSLLSVEDLREVRINFVARTRLEDPQFPTGSFKATENRNAVGGTDGFRRRVHTSTIMPRNLVNRMNVL